MINFPDESCMANSMMGGVLRGLGAAVAGPALFLAQTALADPYTVVAVSNGGSIEGVVKLSGDAPAIAPIKVTKNQDYCGTSIPSPVYVVGKNGGLQGRAIQGRLTVNPILTNRGCPL